MRPVQFAIYKGMGSAHGAAQFDLDPAHEICKVCEKRWWWYGNKASCDCSGREAQVTQGALFLSMASTVGKNQYDWTNKIVFALSVTDQSKLLHGLLNQQELKDKDSLIHDPGAGGPNKGKVVKSLTLVSPGGWEKGAMLTLSEKTGDQVKKHTVPLSPVELTTLKVLLSRSIYQTLGW